MTEQTQNTAEKKDARQGLPTSWPILRKFETIVFGCMLALLPFFAFKVLNITTTQLAVKNSAVDLVNDLRKAKQMARDHGVNISVVSRKGDSLVAPAYLIQDDQRTIEEVQLLKGVSIDGTVKFDSRGLPASESVFTITKGHNKAIVKVDATGETSSP